MKAVWFDDVFVEVLCILFPSLLSSIRVFIFYLLLTIIIRFQYPSFINPVILPHPFSFFFFSNQKSHYFDSLFHRP